MLIHTDYIEPAELTGYAREALFNLPINRSRLARWLPHRFVDDIEARFRAGGEGLSDTATFRAYDAESAIGGRPGIQRTTVQLPPISRKIRLGEYDRLRQRQRPDDPILNTILGDTDRLVREIAARIELARGDALTNGTVTLNEGGLVVEVDFGRVGGHTTSPAGADWDTVATALVLTDLIAWADAYEATNGDRPGAILTSRTVHRLMQRNIEVRNAIAGDQTGRTRVTAAELDALLGSEGLPPVETYDARVNVAGQARRVIPESAVLLLPMETDPFDEAGTDLGATFWGTTSESLEPDYGMEGEEPGIVAGNYRTEDPVAIWTKAAGISFPILANPDLSFLATVFVE